MVHESERRRPTPLLSILRRDKEKRLPAVKTQEIRRSFPNVGLLGDNHVSVTCRGANNLQLRTNLSLGMHEHFLNISRNSERQICWGIIILQLKSHLNSTTLIIFPMLPIMEASQVSIFGREMFPDCVT